MFSKHLHSDKVNLRPFVARFILPVWGDNERGIETITVSRYAAPHGAAAKVNALIAPADLLLSEHVTAAHSGDRVRPRVFGYQGGQEQRWRLYTNLDGRDVAAWTAWVESPDIQEFLDDTINECQRLADGAAQPRSTR